MTVKPPPVPEVDVYHMTDLARAAMARDRAKARARYEANRDDILAKAKAKNAASRTTKIDQRTPEQVVMGRARYKIRQFRNDLRRAELRAALIATGLDPLD